MEISGFNRHDLLYYSGSCRESLFEEAWLSYGSKWPREELENLIGLKGGVDIPAIVSRQTSVEADMIWVGLSSPYRQDGERLRVSALIPLSAIERRLTPYEIVKDFPQKKTLHVEAKAAVLEQALALAKERDVSCGVYGSTALELMTGLPYCHEDSDLDLVVRSKAGSQLKAFYEGLEALEKASGTEVDAELQLVGGLGVKLKEYFGASHSVLVKGFYDVELLDKAEAQRLEHE